VENILGFGKRLVVWVSGCPFRCEGCIVPNLQNENTGKEYKDFYKEIEPFLDKVDGITFSGGEPLFWAKELLELLERLKDIDKMLFTGYYYDELNEIQRECFNKFDLVVEGRFEKEKMGNFLWRGSSNQIFSSPTGKYDAILDKLYKAKSAGIEVVVKENECIFYGIPTKTNEIEQIKKELSLRGFLF
jgi:anaerobic ribonucleoside-triphosphate reductase activating protein